MPYALTAVAICLLMHATGASDTPREGTEYMMRSSEGRLLCVSEEHGIRLQPSDNAEHCTFQFVRANDLVYLRFGEHLLTGYLDSGEPQPLFRLFTRPADGRVALRVESQGTGLRASRGQGIEQGDWSMSDEAMWWALLPGDADATHECPAEHALAETLPSRDDVPPRPGFFARPRRGGRRGASRAQAGAPKTARPTAVRLAARATTAPRVLATSALTVVGATVALLPAGALSALAASFATTPAAAPLAALLASLHAVMPPSVAASLRSVASTLTKGASGLRAQALAQPLLAVLLLLGAFAGVLADNSLQVRSRST